MISSLVCALLPLPPACQVSAAGFLCLVTSGPATGSSESA